MNTPQIEAAMSDEELKNKLRKLKYSFTSKSDGLDFTVNGFISDKTLELIMQLITAHTQSALDRQEASTSKLIANAGHQAAIRELTHWANFFEDDSMNGTTPSERLNNRINELKKAKGE